MDGRFADLTGAQAVWQLENAIVDICFVHGLGGGRYSTWKKGEVFWPYNLLARDIPDARIITWGYNADVGHFLSPTSANSVKDHAKSLSNDISGMRQSPEVSKRPIIFIAHSLGGIICAQSLLQAYSENPKDAGKLADHTDALAFMGTPFEGSDTAKWSSFFKKLSNLLPTASINEGLLNNLQTDSHDLKVLGEDFPKWLNNRRNQWERQIHVVCFFEELATQKWGHIVPSKSAQLVGHEAVSLNDDHAGICKFDNFEDPKYKIVLNNLKKWIEEIKAASSEKLSESIPNLQANTTMGKNYGGTQTGQDNSKNKQQHMANSFQFGSKEDDD